VTPYKVPIFLWSTVVTQDQMVPNKPEYSSLGLGIKVGYFNKVVNYLSPHHYQFLLKVFR